MSEGGRYEPNAPGGEPPDAPAPGSDPAWQGSPPEAGRSAAPGELAGLVNPPPGGDPGQGSTGWAAPPATTYPAAGEPPDASQVPPGTPPPGWTPPGTPAPAQAASGRSQIMQFVIGGAIIAIIAIAFFIFRDRLSGSAGDLRLGDCFDNPGTATEVSDVQHQPCTEAHDREVIFVGDYPDQDAYPGGEAFDTYAAQNCTAAYETYIGRDYETDTEYDFGYFYPLSEGWSDGDHEITCYIYRLDDQKMTQSVKAS